MQGVVTVRTQYPFFANRSATSKKNETGLKSYNEASVSFDDSRKLKRKRTHLCVCRSSLRTRIGSYIREAKVSSDHEVKACREGGVRSDPSDQVEVVDVLERALVIAPFRALDRHQPVVRSCQSLVSVSVEGPVGKRAHLLAPR